jgi:uncharacterized membrane protein
MDWKELMYGRQAAGQMEEQERSDANDLAVADDVATAREQILRPTGKTNRLAVFALFCAFVVPVLGIVFGLTALREIEDADGAEPGAGMATWAVTVGLLMLTIAVGLGIWFGVSLS